MYDLAPLDYYFLRESDFTLKFAIEIPGTIDKERLKRAISDLQFYEPILRSGIAYKDEKTVCLKLLKNYQLDFSFEESSIDLPDEIIRNKFLAIKNLPDMNLVKFKLIQGASKSFLLLSMSHLLGDGHSYFLLLKAISNFYSGVNYQPFIHSRDEFDSNIPELIHPSDLELEEMVFRYSGYSLKSVKAHSHFLTEDLKYSKAGLFKLIAMAKEQGLSLSSHVLLMSLMAKEKYKQLSTSQEQIHLRTPVDYRRKLGLSQNFFGNAIVDAHASFDREELQHADVFKVAEKIKESIQQINSSYVFKQASALKTLRLRKGIQALRTLYCPGTVFTNFSQMPLSSLSFDQVLPKRLIYGQLYPNFVLIREEQEVRYELSYHH